MQASRIEGQQTNHNIKDFVELPGLTSIAYDDYFTVLATSAAEATLPQAQGWRRQRCGR